LNSNNTHEWSNFTGN